MEGHSQQIHHLHQDVRQKQDPLLSRRGGITKIQTPQGLQTVPEVWGKLQDGADTAGKVTMETGRRKKRIYSDGL